MASSSYNTHPNPLNINEQKKSIVYDPLVVLHNPDVNLFGDSGGGGSCSGGEEEQEEKTPSCYLVIVRASIYDSYECRDKVIVLKKTTYRKAKEWARQWMINYYDKPPRSGFNVDEYMHYVDVISLDEAEDEQEIHEFYYAE